MADWTTITDTQVDPKAPVTSELMTALRDNPLAIAQGTANAPRIAEKIQAAQGLNEAWATITGLDEAGGVYVDFYASIRTSEFNSGSVQFEISTNGSTFTGTTTLIAVPVFSGSAATTTGSLFIDFTSGAYISASVSGGDVTDPNTAVTSGTLSGAPLAIKSIRLRALGDSTTSDIAIIARAQGGLSAV
jgi:hypothetical protein